MCRMVRSRRRRRDVHRQGVGIELYKYTVCGIGFFSALRLPECCEGAERCEVDIALARLRPSVEHDEHGFGHRLDQAGQQAVLSWRGIGAFEVLNGNRILADPVEGVDERLFRLFLYSGPLAVLLYQRGRALLHASAVSINRRAAVFIGSPGLGKSTTAAALSARGHGLLADDLTAIDLDGARPTTAPVLRQLRLLPDSLRALGHRAEDLDKINPKEEKRIMEMPAPLSAAAEVGRIFLLAEGDAPAIEPLCPQDSLIEITRHSYGVRAFQPLDPANHFRLAAKLVNSVPVRRLYRSRSLAGLDVVTQLVEEEMAREP